MPSAQDENLKSSSDGETCDQHQHGRKKIQKEGSIVVKVEQIAQVDFHQNNFIAFAPRWLGINMPTNQEEESEVGNVSVVISQV